VRGARRRTVAGAVWTAFVLAAVSGLSGCATPPEAATAAGPYCAGYLVLDAEGHPLYVDTRHKHTCAEVYAQHPNFMPGRQAENTQPPPPVDPQAAAAAARAAENTAKRRAIEAKFRNQLNDIIAKDAAGWLANRYDDGSVTDIQAEQRNGRLITLKGAYTYNNGQPGTVKVEFQHKGGACVEYWDTPGVCRPLSVTRQALFAAAMAEAAKHNRTVHGSSHGYYRPQTTTSTSPDNCTMGNYSALASGAGGAIGGLWMADGCP
jgi:hypothetical protein